MAAINEVRLRQEMSHQAHVALKATGEAIEALRVLSALKGAFEQEPNDYSSTLFKAQDLATEVVVVQEHVQKALSDARGD